jgi:hypothetical protein
LADVAGAEIAGAVLTGTDDLANPLSAMPSNTATSAELGS